MALISSEISEVYIFIGVDFVAKAFSHIFTPAALIHAYDLIESDWVKLVFINLAQRLLQVNAYAISVL